MEGKLNWFGVIAKSSWEMSKLVEEPAAVIAINDLELQSPVGKDAWGSGGVEQPVHISVAISLRHPFKSSSDGDVLAADTIHYGLIKGAITHAVEEFTKAVNERNLRHNLRYLMQYLASAFHTHGHDKYLDLTGNVAKSSEFAIMLPKASALGTGVSLTLTKMYYKDGQQQIECAIYSVRLQLHDIKVPTLIGILPKERLAKQNVVANVVLDNWKFTRDSYNDVEQVVVKVSHPSWCIRMISGRNH
jgi:dihydroneopterin aldolase